MSRDPGTSGKTGDGTPYAVLQCVLVADPGGMDPDGGSGRIAGVTLATLILRFLSSGLHMFNSVSNFYRAVIRGAGLILVLLFSRRFPGMAGTRAARQNPRAAVMKAGMQRIRRRRSPMDAQPPVCIHSPDRNIVKPHPVPGMDTEST